MFPCSLSHLHKHTFHIFSCPFKLCEAERLKNKLEAFEFVRHDACLYCGVHYFKLCCRETEQLACVDIGVLVYLKT